MMTTIETVLYNTINKHPKKPLVIAYSGGVDSQVLLHALANLKHANKLPNPITVCHVNHGLSDNASEWQNFAKIECQKLKLTLVTCLVSVQRQKQQSLEALARAARYEALHAVYDEPSLIITGHHRDDQAETFLLALKRGAGLKGLSAMSIETKQDKDLLMRPLLNTSRAEIVSTAKQQHLSWVEDESNSDTHFDRNFIRQKVMPLLSERWPSITETINRSSGHCEEGQLLLNELAEQDLITCQLSKNCLSVDELNKLSVARFNNLVRFFLGQCGQLMPSTEQLAQVHQQLLASKDKNPAVKVANNYLRRYKDALYLTADFVDISDWSSKITLNDTNPINLAKAIDLPDSLGKLVFSQQEFLDKRNKGLNLIQPSDISTLTVCFTHANPKCLPDYRNHSRNLKKILQELNIPPWQRKRIPFIYYDDKLVAAAGHFVCQEFLPKDNHPSITVTWDK